LTYVGAFTEPGEAGHFHAFDDQTTETVWDRAARIESMSDGQRRLYTAAADGARLEFDDAYASNDALEDVVRAPDARAADRLLAWYRSARFGWAGTQPLQRRGGIVESTAAVLTPP
jgi:hypothetical protein